MSRLPRGRSTAAAGSDAGVSDMIGTILLLGMTATLVSAVLLDIMTPPDQAATAPRLDLKASASLEDPGNVTLTHAGGRALERADLRVVVDSGGAPHRVGPLGAAGPWTLGESITVPLDRPLSAEEQLEVTVVSVSSSRVLATAAVDVVRPVVVSSAAIDFTLAIREPSTSAAPEVTQGSAFRIVAEAAHTHGRKAVLLVSMNLSAIQGSPAALLYDDGTHGDEIAGDLNYSAIVFVPPEAPPSVVTIPLTALDIDGRRTPAAPEALLTIKVLLPTSASPPGPPEILSVSPLSGMPNTKIAVSGKNFSFVNSVSLVDSATGAAHGAMWWLGAEDRLYVVAPVGAPPNASYHVTATTPTGSDISSDAYFMEGPGASVASISAPVIDGFTPTIGPANTEVVVAGRHFTYTTGATLTNDTVSYPVVPWNEGVDGTELHFLVPRGIPPGPYRITVTNPNGTATTEGLAPANFTVPPPDQMFIADFNPKSGIPYTSVTILGGGFKNAVAVTVGGVGVSYWIASDTEIRLITHMGVPQGNQTITVYNLTGSIDKRPFDALPPVDVPEVSVYPNALFGAVGHMTTKSAGATGTGDHVQSLLKFNLTADNIVSGADTYTFKSATLVYVPFKPGDSGRISMTPMCSPAAGADGRVGVWLFKVDADITNYVRDEDSFRFYYEMTWSNGLTGNRYAESTFFVDSSIERQYFSLRPRDPSKVVLDAGNWPSTFADCTA